MEKIIGSYKGYVIVKETVPCLNENSDGVYSKGIRPNNVSYYRLMGKVDSYGGKTLNACYDRISLLDKGGSIGMTEDHVTGVWTYVPKKLGFIGSILFRLMLFFC